MKNIIVITPEELEGLIETSLRKVLSEQTLHRPIENETYLTVKEAAPFLNLAKQTLYGFTSKNLIPHIKRAKKLLFLKSDLEKWLLEGKHRSISEIRSDFERK